MKPLQLKIHAIIASQNASFFIEEARKKGAYTGASKNTIKKCVRALDKSEPFFDEMEDIAAASLLHTTNAHYDYIYKVVTIRLDEIEPISSLIDIYRNNPEETQQFIRDHEKINR